MKIFDPIAQRRLLDGHIGYEWALSKPFEDARNVREIVGMASSDLNMAVRCILVGYDEPAKALIVRAFDWLNTAARSGEMEPLGHLDLALCAWLLNGEHDAENFSIYVHKMEDFLIKEKLTRDKLNINLTLPSYVDAGAYREALERFHHAGMTPPASLTRIRSEGAMSYVLCRHYLGEEYDAADIASVVTRFLKYNVNTWLTNGHYLRAAEWMKIAHWSGEASAASAWDAVLHCYDYLAASPPARAE